MYILDRYRFKYIHLFNTTIGIEPSIFQSNKVEALTRNCCTLLTDSFVTIRKRVIGNQGIPHAGVPTWSDIAPYHQTIGIPIPILSPKGEISHVGIADDIIWYLLIVNKPSPRLDRKC